MNQTKIVCPSCGSHEQEKLSGNTFICGSCGTKWSAEGPENPPEAETIEKQEEQVEVVVPCPIKATFYLREKGYAVQSRGSALITFGISEPPANCAFIDFGKPLPPTVHVERGLFGRTTQSLSVQHPYLFARLWFYDEERGITQNHWRLDYRGSENTEEVSALAHEMAGKFDVKIFVVLERA